MKRKVIICKYFLFRQKWLRKRSTFQLQEIIRLLIQLTLIKVVVPYLEVVCTVGLDEVEEGLPVGGVHQPVVEHPVHLMAPQPPQKAFIEKNYHFYFYGSIVHCFLRERKENERLNIFHLCISKACRKRKKQEQILSPTSIPLLNLT